jgi:2-polyprenyl-3-methyl-5-hydroxy-6-metoxy-1,4-benzoquinol methylase
MVTLTTDPERFFTERHDTYARFIRWMRYPQGLRAFFLASPLMRRGLRILDAGCGTGALAIAVHGALVRREMAPAVLQAFDLTPAMLEHFRVTLQRRGIAAIELAQANVLQLDALPEGWTDYDLIVSASMLEYVPRHRFVDALRGLRARLRSGGHFILFMTRRNPLTRVLIGLWWASNLYTQPELRDAFHAAGFSTIAFRRFPLSGQHLAVWGHIVEARR